MNFSDKTLSIGTNIKYEVLDEKTHTVNVNIFRFY